MRIGGGLEKEGLGGECVKRCLMFDGRMMGGVFGYVSYVFFLGVRIGLFSSTEKEPAGYLLSN